MPKTISIQNNLAEKCPQLVLAVIQCKVSNSEFDSELWERISNVSSKIREDLKIEQVKHVPTIDVTRVAYKQCGKDPNRYRPSAEQLNRRILQGKELYQMSTLVDLVNLVSLKSGYSIGGFDADKIQGNLEYGIGEKDELYNGIGRGALNIEGLPILRDEKGGIGTPTSDEERTMLLMNTTSFLMNINAFDGKTAILEENVQWAVELLMSFASAHAFDIRYFHASK